MVSRRVLRLGSGLCACKPVGAALLRFVVPIKAEYVAIGLLEILDEAVKLVTIAPDFKKVLLQPKFLGLRRVGICQGCKF